MKIFLFLSITLNAFLAYSFLDTAVRYEYLQRDFHAQQYDKKGALFIINEIISTIDKGEIDNLQKKLEQKGGSSVVIEQKNDFFQARYSRE